MDIYLEIGEKRVFAGAIDWPGWSRSGRDEAGALVALLAYSPRYARAIASAGLTFDHPTQIEAFSVVERLPGNATTDFGAPDARPQADFRPFDAAELARSTALLKAVWQSFDGAVVSAAGIELRKGPRGGGRDLEAIQDHVSGADAAYLSRLAWKRPKAGVTRPEELTLLRAAILDALAAAARGELPKRGPRGGDVWPARYFVRRSAWHMLDHVWEIEDRLI